MPNAPISGLPVAAALSPADPIPTVQGGVTVQTTAGALAAAALAAVPVIHPGYVAGRTYPIAPRAAAGTNIAVGAAGTIYYAPLVVFAAMSVSHFVLRTGTTNAVAGQVNVSVYDNAGGVPGAKVFDAVTAGAVPATASTNLVFALGAAQPLAPNVFYWVAVQFDTTPQMFANVQETSIQAALMGTTNAAAYASASAQGVGYTEAGVFGAMPATAAGVFSMSTQPGPVGFRGS